MTSSLTTLNTAAVRCRASSRLRRGVRPPAVAACAQHVSGSKRREWQQHSAAALAAVLASISIVVCPTFATPMPQFSGVDDAESDLVQGLLKRSAENKSKYDQDRLDNFYERQYNINKLAAKIGVDQVLPEPCDPRDPEFSSKFGACVLVPRLPEDRLDPEALERYRAAAPPANAPRVGNLLGPSFD